MAEPPARPPAPVAPAAVALLSDLHAAPAARWVGLAVRRRHHRRGCRAGLELLLRRRRHGHAGPGLGIIRRPGGPVGSQRELGKLRRQPLLLVVRPGRRGQEAIVHVLLLLLLLLAGAQVALRHVLHVEARWGCLDPAAHRARIAERRGAASRGLCAETLPIESC